nr:MAG TPA: hypothetical protein [Caudoviricetes sp.]
MLCIFYRNTQNYFAKLMRPIKNSFLYENI